MVLTIARRLLPLLLITMVFSGCVTTERGGVGTKADKEKALEYSVSLARNYIRSGNWEAAKRHLRTAIEIDDSSAEVYEAMALVFQNTGEFEFAEENYKKSIKLDSDFSRVRNNYAAFLYQQRRYEEAAEQLEMVVADTLYDKRSGAYINLGRAYMQLDKIQEAEQAFYRAHLMARRNVPLLYQLADVYYRLEQFPKSQSYYDAYRSQVKQQPAQALWLGIRLADKFGDNDSLSSYSLALKNLYPTSKEYLEYREQFINE
ncbi:type IV pilus biogenesis/stability protein PilW [Oceanicoccus sagamiensis]|uniref:Type IV pilus biogenesis/stability protein PilW n=1 Tax=Oceanicoccus sagamiensis TaxID=716816 RepID=A0A1X9NMM2_9GAMM|nr:type IV pilus biogenesis/stability protein PilW [Oceanicoccus sagamiensis]ARN76037.1 type IV pilus biogenesis/stability protein PilW [Oceanicoccus sagamiensis]